MPGIKKGEMAASKRSDARASSRRRRARKSSKPSTKRRAQKAWRRSLGRSGRAAQAAVDYARKLLRALRTKPRVCVLPDVSRFGPHVEVEYYALRVKKWKSGKICRWLQTNFSARRPTGAWGLVEREKKTRRGDGRLGKYLAVPCEMVRAKKKRTAYSHRPSPEPSLRSGSDLHLVVVVSWERK